MELEDFAMKTLALDSLRLPVAKRTMRKVAPRFVKHFRDGRKEILTKAACQMADLLEQQSALLSDLGMCQVAREACKEVRQLRLLAALEA